MGIGCQSQESGDISGEMNKDTEAGLGLCFSGEAGGAGPTQATRHDIPATSEQPGQSSSADTIQPLQARWQRFSHVEIRNIQPPTAASVPTEPDGESASVETGKTHCSSHNYGPWRLNGTTLSIDIRDIGRIPVMAGFSTYRVVDGHLFQTLTLGQGPIGFPVIREETNSAGKRHGRGMRKARKCDNVAASPDPPRCRPLSLKEKRRLSRLREEGRTWNDIASRFPGKKKDSRLSSSDTPGSKRVPRTPYWFFCRNRNIDCFC